MPGIVFAELVRLLPTLSVLQYLGIKATQVQAAHWYGPCPLHEEQVRRLRSLHLNMKTKHWWCNVCNAKGDLLDLYALVKGLTLPDAARDACERFAVTPPVYRDA